MPKTDVDRLWRIFGLYTANCNDVAHSTAGHLETLRRLAQQCERVVEFGVQRGESTTALLVGLGASDARPALISYDIKPTPQARALEKLAGDMWSYRIEDCRYADVPECDMLFIDTLHTYAQMRAELMLHGNKPRKYLVCHDVTTFGEVGGTPDGHQLWQYERGKTVPQHAWGIRPAIDDYMSMCPWWRIYRRDVHSHGLLVLRSDP